MFSRLERAAGPDAIAEFAAAAAGDDVAAVLLQGVALAAARGVDAEGALREALRRLLEARDGVGPGPGVGTGM